MSGGGWTWGEHVNFPGVLAAEYAYSARECQSLVQAYGRTMTRIMTRSVLGDRFSVVARGPVTGMVLGYREWAWSTALRDWEPAGDYMDGWREAVRQFYELTGELIERRRFSPLAQGVLTSIPRQAGTRAPLHA
jgi:hypothetical protein